MLQSIIRPSRINGVSANAHKCRLALNVFVSILFTDQPGRPGRPEITDWDANGIDLQWTGPMKDGSVPIECYIVELKDLTANEWTKCAEVPGTSASVRGLKEGQQYQFRVKAVHEERAGVPSDPSDKQIAKARWGELFFVPLPTRCQTPMGWSTTCSVHIFVCVWVCLHCTPRKLNRTS